MVWYDITTVGANSYTALLSAQGAINDHLRAANRASVATVDPATGERQIFIPGGGAPDQDRIWDGSAWQPVADIGIRSDESIPPILIAGVSATVEVPLLVVPGTVHKRTIVRCRLVSSATTTSTGSDHWVIDLKDRGTAGGAGASLLTAALDTNGSDFTAWVPQSLSINASALANVLAHSRVLTLTFTKNASATTMPFVLAQLELSGQ